MRTSATEIRAPAGMALLLVIGVSAFAGVSSPTPESSKPRDLGAEVIAEYLQQNPNLHAQLKAQRQQSMEAANALRNDPKTGPVARIFLPPRPPVQSSVQVMQDDVDAHLSYLNHMERRAGRALTISDIGPYDPEGFMLVPGMFIRGTLWALQREGQQGAIDFACGFIDACSARKADFRDTWGRRGYEEYLAAMFWMTAGAQEAAGDAVGAGVTLQKALDADMKYPLVSSIRYMKARALHRVGQDLEAAEILRALAANYEAKATPLRLPEEIRTLGSVYSESVALLESIRRDTGAPSSSR